MTVSVIAECAQSHMGNVVDARRMIREAKSAQADYVKFQLLKANLLFPKEDPFYARVKEAELSIVQMRELKVCADDHGIGFICTPFYPEAVEEIASLNPAFIKIRERDSSNTDLIESALKTRKKLLISATQKPEPAKYRYHPSIRWLWCIPKYPPEPEDMRFAASIAFDGLSDHFPDTVAALAFVTLALEHQRKEIYLEKHVTLDKNMPTLDKAVSIDFAELADLVHRCRQLEKMRFEFS